MIRGDCGSWRRFGRSISFVVMLWWFGVGSVRPVSGGSRGRGVISQSTGTKNAVSSGTYDESHAGRDGYSDSAYFAGCRQACARRNCSREQAIKETLLCGYDRTTRPVTNASSCTSVNIAVALFHVLDTDEKHQTFTALVSVRMRWRDEYLTWDEEAENTNDALHIPATDIWTPDIVISNSADESSRNVMPTNAIVKSDGSVLWMFPALIKVTCKLNVKHFPFDSQRCGLVFISWTYNGNEIDVQHNESLDANKNYYKEDNQEWNITGITQERHEQQYACCKEVYPDLTITVYMKRRSLFYVFNLIFPCILMYAASFLGFFLPTESGEKVNLELTILLALVVFLLIIGETLPPTPDAIPLLGLLFGTTMIMISVALVMGVIVTNIHTRKCTATPVPPWLQRYLRVFHCKAHSSHDRQRRIQMQQLHQQQQLHAYTVARTRFIRKILRPSVYLFQPSTEPGAADTAASPTHLHDCNHRYETVESLRLSPGQELTGEHILTADTGFNKVTTTGNNYRATTQPTKAAVQQSHHEELTDRLIQHRQCNGHIGASPLLAKTAALHSRCTETSPRQRSGSSPDRSQQQQQQQQQQQPLRRTCSHLSLQDYPPDADDNADNDSLGGDLTATQRQRRQRATERRRKRDRCICNNPDSWVILARQADRFLFWLFLVVSATVLGTIFYEIPRQEEEHG